MNINLAGCYIKYENYIGEFYDLLNDPDEQYNISKTHNKDFKEMELAMENFIKKIKNIEELKKNTTIKEKDIIIEKITNIKFDKI